MTTRFDPEAHRYFVGDRPVPGVTAIINDVLPGFKAARWFLDRGAVVHACAALIAQGKDFTLDLSNQSPEDRVAIEGKIAAVRKFIADVKPEFSMVEQRVFSTAYRFAGTLDAVMMFRYRGRPTPAVVDWKGSLDQRVQYQVAGYSLALAESGTQITHGFGVELRNDGSFKMSSVYDLMRGRQQFLALLSVYNMRRDAGIPVEGAV